MSGSSDQRYRSVIKCTTDTKLSSKFIVESFADEFASLILDVEIKKSPLSLFHWTKIGRVQFNIHHVKNQSWGSKSFDLGTWTTSSEKIKRSHLKKLLFFLYEVIMHHYWPQEYLPGTLHNQFKMDVWWFPSISFVKVWFIIQLKTTISNWMFRIPWNLLHHF